MEYVSSSQEETTLIGEQLGKAMKSGAVICLYGDLGSGKTTLVKGIAKGFGGYREEDVNSPTFVYLNIYEGQRFIYHYDLYRLNDPEDFFHLGLDEFLYGEGVCCIEWPERMGNFLPPNRWDVQLEHLDEGLRKISFYEVQ